MASTKLNILITGASGFLGGHLLSQLKARGSNEIFPVSLDGSGHRQCDLSRKDGAYAIVDSIRPTEIYHCAGTFSNDFETDFRANVLTTYHLLTAVSDLALSCRVLLIGSSAEYGQPEPDSGPIAEDHPLNPESVYGLTKTFQTEVMGYFQRKLGLDIVMARIFNLDGEGISPALFPGRVRMQIKDYLAGKTEMIQVGDLSAQRDYLPVEAAVADLIAIMAHGKAGEIYNVGSGSPVRMSDFLNGLLNQHGIGMEQVSSNAGLETRTSAVSRVAADVSKLQTLMSDCGCVDNKRPPRG